MLSDAGIALVAAIGGVIFGFVISRVSDWFENRAEADTPEDDKWELYTLLTYCNVDGVVGTTNRRYRKYLRLSAKQLNELSIASINSTRDRNNYRSTFTMKHFRRVIVRNLSNDELIRRVGNDTGIVHKLLKPASKVGFLQNRLRYTLARDGAAIMNAFVKDYRQFLYDKQRDSRQQLNIVHVDPLRTDQVRIVRWGEIVAAFENLAGLTDEVEREKTRQRLELERDGLMAEFWTCEDWLTKMYRLEIDKHRKRITERRKRIAQYKAGIAQYEAERPERIAERRKHMAEHFEQSEERRDTQTSEDTTWYVLRGWPSGEYVEAHGYFVGSHEFHVVTDEEKEIMSYASKAEAVSLMASHRSLRDTLRKVDPETGKGRVLIDDGQRLRFTRSYTFASSSQAASVVLGRASSGPNEWKQKESA